MRENESAKVYLALACACVTFTILAALVLSPLAIVGIIPTVLFLLFATMAILGVDWLEA